MKEVHDVLKIFGPKRERIKREELRGINYLAMHGFLVQERINKIC
jgi:hypothetical protein